MELRELSFAISKSTSSDTFPPAMPYFVARIYFHPENQKSKPTKPLKKSYLYQGLVATNEAH